MTDHLRRIREHMALETRALELEADRARLLDGNTNRGSEAEHGVLRWLRARFAPGYTVSSGEIIDSFDTNATLKSRQQDGILHSNSPDANRFLLPSGQRLLPIETVAAVIEVKLTLTKGEFETAEEAAKETARLRYRAYYPIGLGASIRGSEHATFPIFGDGNMTQRDLTPEEGEQGLRVLDFDVPPITFALFSFGGISDVATISSWMKGTTISVVCCLSAGCVLNLGLEGKSQEVAITTIAAEDSLWHFSDLIAASMWRHERHLKHFRADFNGYAPYKRTFR